MMEQLTIEDAIARAEVARELRDDGMRRAVDHANHVEPGWQERAIEHVRAFVMERREFMCEDAREFAEARGMSLPPDNRAWGAVMTKCARLGLIVKDRLGYAKDPKVHMRPTSVWRSRALP